MPRLYLSGPLVAGMVDLPPAAVRHARALRLRAGDALVLFDGSGGEWEARLVNPPPAARVEILRHLPVERELSPAVTLAVGMPANERMDWLVEKATELGAAAVQPLMTSRTVLRLEGERAVRRAAHWQAIAQAACEQCGRNRIPAVPAATRLEAWLASLPPQAGTVARCVLSAPGQGQALSFAAWVGAAAGWSALTVLSGPEGGLSPEETSLAVRAGFVPVSLGPRVLRAETAPLALLGAWAALSTGS